MKKVFLLAVIGLSLLTVVSCGNKEIQQTKGVVTSIKVVEDSLATANIVVDGDTLLFKLADARFVNGMFLKGDSVTIDYIEGRGDTLRALGKQKRKAYWQFSRFLVPSVIRSDPIGDLGVEEDFLREL